MYVRETTKEEEGRKCWTTKCGVWWLGNEKARTAVQKQRNVHFDAAAVVIVKPIIIRRKRKARKKGWKVK